MKTKITLKWIKSLKKLHRNKDTYGFVWEVYGSLTLFRIKDNGGSLFTVTIHQNLMTNKEHRDNILLGKVDTQEELKEMFKLITRGVNLK